MITKAKIRIRTTVGLSRIWKNDFSSTGDSPDVPMTDEDVMQMAEYYGYGMDPGSEFD